VDLLPATNNTFKRYIVTLHGDEYPAAGSHFITDAATPLGAAEQVLGLPLCDHGCLSKLAAVVRDEDDIHGARKQALFLTA
jgi:hypothetical protein